MTAIAGEHIEKAPTNAVTKARLKWLAYAALGGLIVFAGARYGYDRAPPVGSGGTTSRRCGRRIRLTAVPMFLLCSHGKPLEA